MQHDKTDKIKIENIVQYRKIWMAVAMVSVMIYHSGIDFHNTVLNGIRDFGYGGVDIFFFASGFGCYLSYIKDCDAGSFFKRRMIRILPSYFCFIIPWLVYRSMYSDMPFTSVLGNFFSIEGIKGSGYEYNWYISAIWLFYCMTPLMSSLVKKHINNCIQCLLLVCIFTVFSFSFWDLSNYLIIVTRLSVFFLGMCLAKIYQDGVSELKKIHYILAVILFVAGICMLVLFDKNCSSLMWSKGLYWYPFIMIVPGFCLLISCFSFFISNCSIGRSVLKSLEWFGGITWETYLTHIGLMRVFVALVNEQYVQDRAVLRLLTLIVAVITAAVLKRISLLLFKIRS